MTIEINHQYHTFYTVPTTVSTENILINGRTELYWNQILFDWPNVSLTCQIPVGQSTFYFRGEGINLMKVKVKQTDGEDVKVIMKQPSHQIAKQLQEDVIYIESSYCVVTITNTSQHPLIISFVKISEARDGALSFYGSEKKMEPMPQSQQLELEGRKRVEFIGDSLMCGYGIFPVKGSTSVPVQSDSSQSFVSLISDHFNWKSHMIAWSGIGLVRNFEDIIFPNDEKNVMRLWQKTSAGEKDLDYSFDFNPHYVVIDIGHNDFWDVGVTCPQRQDIPGPYYGEDEEDVDDVVVDTEVEAVDSSKDVKDLKEDVKEDQTMKESLPESDNTESNDKVSDNTNEKPLEEKTESSNKSGMIPSMRVDDWKLKHSFGETILDDYLKNDDSDLDAVFEKKGIDFLSLILEKYHDVEKIFVIIGPYLAREGETAWKKVIEQMNEKDSKKRFVALNCQLCVDVMCKRSWGYNRHPNASAHVTVANTLIPLFEKHLN